MVEISLSGSGEGPGWETAPGYSTGPFLVPIRGILANEGKDRIRIGRFKDPFWFR
jgi:hypothetical protein